MIHIPITGCAPYVWLLPFLDMATLASAIVRAFVAAKYSCSSTDVSFSSSHWRATPGTSAYAVNSIGNGLLVRRAVRAPRPYWHIHMHYDEAGDEQGNTAHGTSSCNGWYASVVYYYLLCPYISQDEAHICWHQLVVCNAIMQSHSDAHVTHRDQCNMMYAIPRIWMIVRLYVQVADQIYQHHQYLLHTQPKYDSETTCSCTSRMRNSVPSSAYNGRFAVRCSAKHISTTRSSNKPMVAHASRSITLHVSLYKWSHGGSYHRVMLRQWMMAMVAIQVHHRVVMIIMMPLNK